MSTGYQSWFGYYYRNFVLRKDWRNCPACGSLDFWEVFWTQTSNLPFRRVCESCDFVVLNLWDFPGGGDTPGDARAVALGTGSVSPALNQVGRSVQDNLRRIALREWRTCESKPEFYRQEPQTQEPQRTQIDSIQNLQTTQVTQSELIRELLKLPENVVSDQYVPSIRLIKSALILSDSSDAETIGHVAIDAMVLLNSSEKQDWGQQNVLDPDEFSSALGDFIYNYLSSSDYPTVPNAANFHEACMGLMEAFEITETMGACIDPTGLLSVVGLSKDVWNGDTEVAIVTGILSLVSLAIGFPINVSLIRVIHGLTRCLFAEARSQKVVLPELQSPFSPPDDRAVAAYSLPVGSQVQNPQPGPGKIPVTYSENTCQKSEGNMWDEGLS